MYFYIILPTIMISILVVITFRIIKRSRLRTEQLLKVHAFQEENELSNRDLKVFKEVMSEAKKQILQIEKTSKGVTDKQGIILSTLNASKVIFKYLMEEPKDIVVYGDFLYRSLPAFSNALERREAIELSNVSGEYTNQAKNELDIILAELSKNILNEYDQYLLNEIEDSEIDKLIAK